jgi:hypothetical protein
MDVMTLGGIGPYQAAPYRAPRLGQLGQTPTTPTAASMAVGLVGLVAIGGLIFFVAASMGDRYTVR